MNLTRFYESWYYQSNIAQFVWAKTVKISAILKSPSITILLFLLEKGEARYKDLNDLIKSRGTLSKNLKELDQEDLINRRVVTTKPIQTFYSLSQKGQTIAKQFSKIKSLINLH